MGLAPFQVQKVPRSLTTPTVKAIESFARARWDLKPSTLRGYRKTLLRFAREYPTMADLTADNVNDYLASHAEARTMCRNDAIALRQFSQWATKSWIFPSDPLASISLPRGHRRKRKPFADAAIPEIIKAASESNLGPRDAAIVVLGLAAALRPAELWQLRLGDLDLSNGWLQVRAETTKTDAGERTIPLDPQAIAVLDEYIQDHRPSSKYDAVFLNARGDPFRYYGFMAVFARLTRRLKARGIEFSAYRSRHTALTNWARAGVTAPVLKELAGHKSIVTTQNYTGKMSRDDLSRVPQAFTRLYGRIA